MTIKEITALRKAGKLQEALQAAEAEFASAKNRYTVGALYWCLNDLYKTQDREDASLTVERMKALCDTYGAEDELMTKALANAQRLTLPYYHEINFALTRAKSGEDVSDTYSSILQAFYSQSLDRSLYAGFGWLVYNVLKKTPHNDAYNRKLLLNQYFKLELPRPSILHSLILAEAIIIEQNTPLQFRIRDFVRLWGLENLRDDDWKQFKTDEGHTLPSLVEKLIGVYAKEIKTDGIVAPDEFNDLVDKALDLYPLNQNMPYFKAIVLISQGRKVEAIECYRNLILRFPAKYYLWSQLAELIDETDIKLGLLCKALTLGVEDSFLGGIRLRVASLLIAKGQFDNARYELDRYKETYISQGWNLKPEYWQLQNSVANVTPADSNTKVYAQFTPGADNFIYSGLPSIIAIKISDSLSEDRNRPGRRFVQWTLRTENDSLRIKKPSRFGLGKAKNGAVFEVKVYNGKVVWIRSSQVNPLEQDWIKRVEGNVTLRTDRNGNAYAILSGVYVGAKLLDNIATGQSVKVIALRQTDGRWSAISLAKQ